MIVRLLPSQIAAFWPAIEEAFCRANEVPEGYQDEAAITLEVNLLSGKSDCWVIYSGSVDERVIHAIGITEICQDAIRGGDYVFINTLFGLRPLTEELAKDAIQRLTEFARSSGCRRIVALTRYDRVRQLAELTGFKNSYTVHELEV